MRPFTRFTLGAAAVTALALAAGCDREPWWADPAATWITTYGGDRSDVGEDMLVTEDGGYLLVGTSDLEFGPDRRGDVYLIRTDASRDVVWTKTYGGDGLDMGQSVVRTSDGALAIAGWSTSFGEGDADVYLIKVDSDGGELWSTTFGGPLDERASTVLQATDGGSLIVGNVVDPDDVIGDSGAAGYAGYDGRSSIYLARADADGTELWSRVYDTGANVLVSSAVPTPDDGLLILATILGFPEPDDDVYLLRVDAEGNEVWTRSWIEDRSSGTELISTPDGNYLIAGSFAPSDDTDRSEADFLFIKIDPEGNEIWKATFGDPGMIDYASVVAATTDGGYIASGDRTESLFTRSEDLLLVKLDGDGSLIWEQRFETATHNMHGAVLQHPDGGYAVSGSTVMEDGTFDIFLVKTDSEGVAEG